MPSIDDMRKHGEVTIDTDEKTEEERVVDIIIERAGLEDVVSVYNSAIEIDTNGLPYYIDGGYYILHKLIIQAAKDMISLFPQPQEDEEDEDAELDKRRNRI